MRSNILFIIFISSSLFSISAKAQEVQWASAVVAVSSERDTTKTKGNFYQAVQALGRPNRLPQFGESILAWSPAKEKRRRDEFIEVSFAKPMRARQVIVGENFGAGSITQIYIYGEGGQKKRVYHDKFNHPVNWWRKSNSCAFRPDSVRCGFCKSSFEHN